MSARVSTSGLLFGRYRLRRELGRTEAGALFECSDADGSTCAVEVANALPTPEARARFLRDATLAQRLTGRHVLKVLYVGTLPEGVPCVVREPSFSDVETEVETHGAIAVEQAVAWTLEVCEALAEAHAMGIAHGDVRPANVMLAHGEDGAPIAKLAWTTAAKADGVVKEDVARDVAGAAWILRVLATGVIGSVAESDEAPTLPQSLATAVARATTVDGETHLRNVAELARLIAPYAPEGHRSARTISLLMSRAGVVGTPIPAPARPATERLSDEWFGPTERTSYVPAPARRTWPFLFLAIALVGLTVGGTYAAWTTGHVPRWTGTQDEPELVQTTHLTSADTRSEESARTSTEQGIAERSAAIAPSALPKAPAKAWTWSPSHAAEERTEQTERTERTERTEQPTPPGTPSAESPTTVPSPKKADDDTTPTEPTHDIGTPIPPPPDTTATPTE